MGSFNRIQRFPLLPFERDLIDALGISEEEYRRFTAEVQEKGRLRPAEYAHIPDVRNDAVVTPMLISLAIGLLTTGISMLLAPGAPDAPEEAKSKSLADVRGRSRFNQATDFRSVQQIAELGDPVPILFGRYQEGFDDTPAAGGISIAPTLLWSRLLSYGTHQTFRGIYMVSHAVFNDATRNTPQLEGILIGNNALDTMSDRKFALYWSSGTNYGNSQDRLQGSDLLYGSRGEDSAGDRFTTDDPFVVPTNEGTQPGFCMTTQPSNQTSFGCYSPIRNGNSFRVNWDQIPPWFDDAKNETEIRDQRKKIVGRENDGRNSGMGGTGRGYSPKMGLIRHNGNQVKYYEWVDVRVDDTVDFSISRVSYIGKEKELDFDGSTVTGDDLQSTTNSWRGAADDAMMEGEIFQIGDSLWQVQSRDGTYVSEDEDESSDATHTLKCIEILNGLDATLIGIAGTDVLDDFVVDEGGLTGSDEDFENGWIGQLFWPLMKSDIGVVRSERHSETVDVGIASTVYTQLNGLANFPALPTPEEQVEHDEDNIQISPGTQTLYVDRVSFFTVHIRPLGLQADGTRLDFVPTGITFGIKGNRPVEQYNYLRFLCTGVPAGVQEPDGFPGGEFEIRFIGLPMATVSRYQAETDIIYELSAKELGGGQTISNITAHGYTFTISYRGKQTPFGEYFPLQEFINKGKKGSFAINQEVTEGSLLTLDKLFPTWVDSGRLAAYFFELLGDPRDHKNETKSVTERAYSDKWIDGVDPESDKPDDYIKYRLTATSKRTYGHAEKYGLEWSWTDYSWEVRDSDGNWSVNDDSFHMIAIPVGTVDSEGNYIGNPFTFDWADPPNGASYWEGGVNLEVTEVESTSDNIDGEEGRIFEKFSGAADISFYNEVKLSNETQAEHRIAYVNYMNDNPPDYANYNNLALMGLVLQSNGQFPSIDQLRVWMSDGVNCYRFIEDDCGPSNLFTDLAFYLLTDKDNGAGAFIGDSTMDWDGSTCHMPTAADELMIDVEGFRNASYFLSANRLFFDGAIAERTNVRSYLTQLAPLMLCDFEISNGQFNIRPVVPHDEAGFIDPSRLDVRGSFGAGNIIDGSFSVQFLEKNALRDVRLEVLYREMEREGLPESRTLTVNFTDADEAGNNLGLPIEEIDLTSFCTSRTHAMLVARYTLSLKRRVDHTVSFKTIPTQLGLRPGNLVVLQLTSAPYSNYHNGIFDPATGVAKGINPLPDGTHTLKIYTVGKNTEDKEVTVTNGKAVDTEYWGKLFAKVPTTEETRYYKIDKIEMDEDGLIDVTASFYPVENNQSRIALDVLDTESLFTVQG